MQQVPWTPRRKVDVCSQYFVASVLYDIFKLSPPVCAVNSNLTPKNFLTECLHVLDIDQKTYNRPNSPQSRRGSKPSFNLINAKAQPVIFTLMTFLWTIMMLCIKLMNVVN